MKLEYALEAVRFDDCSTFFGPVRNRQEIDRPIRQLDRNEQFGETMGDRRILTVSKGAKLGRAEGGIKLWTRSKPFGPKISIIPKFMMEGGKFSVSAPKAW